MPKNELEPNVLTMPVNNLDPALPTTPKTLPTNELDPNVLTMPENNLDPNMPQLAMFAKRDIKRGEQITFDYCQSTSHEPQSSVLASPSKAVSRTSAEEEIVTAGQTVKSECRCGAKNCRKVLF